MLPSIPSNNDALRTPLSARAIYWRVLFGLLQGLLLYALYLNATAKTWPATVPMLFVPAALLAVCVPIQAIVSSGHLAPRNLLLWLVVMAALLTALGCYDVWRADVTAWLPAVDAHASIAPSLLLVLLCIPGIFIAQAMVLAGNADRKWIAAYLSYFEMAWKLLVQLLFSLLFTSVFWLILLLGSILFYLINLGFLSVWIKQSWFNIPVTTVAFSLALHLSDARPQIVAGIRKLLLTLLSWLLPVATLIVGAFLLGTLATGLHPLWQTRHASHVLLGAAAMLIIFINTAYQDGLQFSAGKQRFFSICCRLACLLLLPLVLLAAYSQGLRVAEYGWTPSRIGAAACTLVAAIYALGYGLSALRWRHKQQLLATINVAASLAILLVMLALLTPLADPARISVTSQLRQLERDKDAAASRFDFVFLRYHGARFGLQALQQLSLRPDGQHAAEIRLAASQALAEKAAPRNQPSAPSALELAANLKMHPAQRTLPPGFLQQNWSQQQTDWELPPCLRNKERHCDVYFVKTGTTATEQLLIFDASASPTLFGADPAGHWYLLGMLPIDNVCRKQLQTAAEHGQLHWQAPLQRDLDFNGVRLRMQTAPQHQQECQQPPDAARNKN